MRGALTNFNQHMTMENEYEYLDDEYDYIEPKFDKPVNYRMATLKRVEGTLNRHRNAGRIITHPTTEQ